MVNIIIFRGMVMRIKWDNVNKVFLLVVRFSKLGLLLL